MAPGVTNPRSFTKMFLDQVALRKRREPGAGLDAALLRAWEESSEAYPEVALDAASFVSHLAARLPEGPETWEEAVGSVRASELFLACACAQGRPEALARLDKDFLLPSAGAIRRVNGAGTFVDDVLQVMREKLLVGAGQSTAKISDFSGRGPLASWVRAAAVRTALNMKVRTGRETLVDPTEWLSFPSGSGAEPELGLLKTRFKKEFSEALHGAFAALTPQERNVLRLHFLDGLTIDKLGLMFQAHRSTAARWVVRAKQTLVEDTKRRMAESLKLRPGELDEMIGQFQSQLDLSLRRFLEFTRA